MIKKRLNNYLSNSSKIWFWKKRNRLIILTICNKKVISYNNNLNNKQTKSIKFHKKNNNY